MLRGQLLRAGEREIGLALAEQVFDERHVGRDIARARRGRRLEISDAQGRLTRRDPGATEQYAHGVVVRKRGLRLREQFDRAGRLPQLQLDLAGEREHAGVGRCRGEQGREDVPGLHGLTGTQVGGSEQAPRLDLVRDDLDGLREEALGETVVADVVLDAAAEHLRTGVLGERLQRRLDGVARRLETTRGVVHQRIEIRGAGAVRADLAQGSELTFGRRLVLHGDEQRDHTEVGTRVFRVRRDGAVVAGDGVLRLAFAELQRRAHHPCSNGIGLRGKHAGDDDLGRAQLVVDDREPRVAELGRHVSRHQAQRLVVGEAGLLPLAAFGEGIALECEQLGLDRGLRERGGLDVADRLLVLAHVDHGAHQFGDDEVRVVADGERLAQLDLGLSEFGRAAQRTAEKESDLAVVLRLLHGVLQLDHGGRVVAPGQEGLARIDELLRVVGTATAGDEGGEEYEAGGGRRETGLVGHFHRGLDSGRA